MRNREQVDYQEVRYFSALNALPAFERAVILSNGPQNAPASNEDSETQAGQAFSLPFKPTQLYARRVLRAELRTLYPKINWQTLGIKSRGYWALRAKMRQAIKKEANIMDSSYNPFRVHNFLRCGARTGGAHLHKYEDGQKRLALLRCSETTACPECADAKAEEVATRTFEYLQAIAEANDIRRMWFFVFTLPQRHEDKPLKGSAVRKSLLNGIKTMVRKTFGLKTRDLLASYCSVHATGGSNLMRTRVHFHVGVLPAAIARKKGAEYAYRNVDPGGLLELEKIRKAWQQCILAAGLTCRDDDINFKAEYVELPDSWGKMRHRISYDLRGFGSDFMQSALYHGGGLACLQAGQDYQAITIEQLARRWRWVRAQRDYRPWGIIAKQEAYSSLLKISKFEETPPDEIEVQDVTVEHEVGRTFDTKKKRVEWAEVTVVTGTDGKVIEGWKLGRLGKRERWWPDNKPRPMPKAAVPEVVPEPDASIISLSIETQLMLMG